MTPFMPTAILLLSLTNADSAPVQELRPQQWRAEVAPSSSDEARTLISAVRGASRGQDPWQRALQSVFVVPGPDVAVEGLAQITEDMAVMCRILDKAVPQRTESGTQAGIWLDGGSGWLVGGRLSTQGLYLDGYGALFFIDVDFPLVAPAQEQTKADGAPSGDSVWSATVDELRGVPQEEARTAGPEYDARKVENLRSTLIRSLRHAANLRMRGPDTALAIVVYRQTSQTRINDLFGGVYGSGYHAPTSGDSTVSPSELSAVLVFRTTKADVDAFAKGGLTQEQFTTKVQVLNSWIDAGFGPTSRGGSDSSLTLPSRVLR